MNFQTTLFRFKTTGLDYAKPLYVKEGDNNELQKCYILLFNCATVRTVNLEITRDFSSKGLVSAISTICL